MKQVLYTLMLISLSGAVYAHAAQASASFEMNSDTIKVNCIPVSNGYLECMSTKAASMKSEQATTKLTCYSKVKINTKTGATQETMVCKEKK